MIMSSLIKCYSVGAPASRDVSLSIEPSWVTKAESAVLEGSSDAAFLYAANASLVILINDSSSRSASIADRRMRAPPRICSRSHSFSSTKGYRMYNHVVATIPHLFLALASYNHWPIGFLKCYAGQSFIIALSCGVLTVTAYEPVEAPLSASAHKSRTVRFAVAGRPMSTHFNVCASEAEPVLITVTTVQFFESGPAQTSGFAGCEPPEQRPTQRP